MFENAYPITGTREEEEDVLQEMFMSVWRSCQTYDPVSASLSLNEIYIELRTISLRTQEVAGENIP